MKKALIILFMLWSISITADAISEIRLGLKTNDMHQEEPFIKRELSIDLTGEAVSYGCYRKGQAPGLQGPSKAEIQEDLTIIAQHWNLIRVYNADDDTERILQVIAENQIPIKVMLGVWLENEDNNRSNKENNITNTLRCIELTNKYNDIVIAVNVGNETQVFWSWHRMAEEDLIRYIRTVRKYTQVPVTTADDYNFWNKPESKKVASEVDFVVTHIYPLWNGKTLDSSIEWLNANYQELKEFHTGKQIVLGEIGWATSYNSEKKGPGEQGTLIKGEVSLKAQETFLMELHNWVSSNQVTTFLFEAFDEPWKGGGEATAANEIEKNWGVFYEDRTPKESFLNYIKMEKMKKNTLMEDK
ncbi:MAG: glycosyl hydrolase family 17 [Candidatus Cloacimonetes bacterium]|nr:glycosyl hydrolase family 17 [Candidatus Cloacimonadota bacterium]